MADISSIDLAELSLAELKTLQRDVAKAIATFEDRKKKEALAELEAKAKEMGFTLNDLVGKAGKAMKLAGVPKFRNPENPAQTWTGKGRRPAWYVEALSSGKSEDDLAI